MESTKGLNFGQALEALNNGQKIKVPEWKGYWFKQSGMIKVMTAEGVVLETPHFQQYIFRTDWEIVQENKNNLTTNQTNSQSRNKLTKLATERLVFCTTFLESLRKQEADNNKNFPKEGFSEKIVEFTIAKNNWEKLLYFIQYEAKDSQLKRVFQDTIVNMLEYHIKEYQWLLENENFTNEHPKILKKQEETIADLKEAYMEAFEIWKDEFDFDFAFDSLTKNTEQVLTMFNNLEPKVVSNMENNHQGYVVAISSFFDNEIAQILIIAENGYEALKQAILEFEGGGVYNSHLVEMQKNNDFPSTFEELSSWLKKYKYSSSVFEVGSFIKNN